MEMLSKILHHPFTWGLLLGLAVAVWALVSGWSSRRALRRETRRVEGLLHRMEDALRAVSEQNAASHNALKAENDDLKQKNENLRISLAEMNNKPERAELQKLYLYDTALRFMVARAPGFATAWEGVLQEAQAEIDKTATGILPWIRRIIHPADTRSSSPRPPALPPPFSPPADTP